VTANLSRHAPSAHRFDFAVTLTLIGILATLLLGYLNKVQHDIERLIVDTELNSFRLSLAESWVHRSVNNQPMDSAALQDSNPILLMAEKPENYIGELSEAPNNKKDIWYFDTKKKLLIYVFNDEDQARYSFRKVDGKSKGSLLTVGGLDLVKDVTEVN
jgi:hypothetical protein